MDETTQTGLGELTRRLIAFRDARDWRRFHGLKNLMLSLNLEAAEVLELAQWKTDAEIDAAAADPGFRHLLGEECADVLLYLLLICERAGIDLAAATINLTFLRQVSNAELRTVGQRHASGRRLYR